MIKTIAAVSLIALSVNAFSEELTVNLKGVIANQGNVYILVFNKADQFPGGTPLKQVMVAASAKSAKLSLQKGVYAVAAFQDRNNNKKLDRNFFGLPKERVGISGKKSFGKPKFSNAAFKLDKNGVILVDLD